MATLVWTGGRVPGSGARTRAAIVRVCAFAGPTPTVPTFQLPLAESYVPWLGVADTKSSPENGNRSCTSTSWATLGPAFESVTVKVMVSPTFGVASLTVFTTARSADEVVKVATSLVT